MSSRKKVFESSLNGLKESLREKPELFEKISEIIRLSEAGSAGGQVKFDDVEEALIPKIRELGREALASWVSSIEEEAGNDLKKSDSTVQQREKNGKNLQRLRLC